MPRPTVSARVQTTSPRVRCHLTGALSLRYEFAPEMPRYGDWSGPSLPAECPRHLDLSAVRTVCNQRHLAPTVRLWRARLVDESHSDYFAMAGITAAPVLRTRISQFRQPHSGRYCRRRQYCHHYCGCRRRTGPDAAARLGRCCCSA